MIWRGEERRGLYPSPRRIKQDQGHIPETEKTATVWLCHPQGAKQLSLRRYATCICWGWRVCTQHVAQSKSAETFPGAQRSQQQTICETLCRACVPAGIENQLLGWNTDISSSLPHGRDCYKVFAILTNKRTSKVSLPVTAMPSNMRSEDILLRLGYARDLLCA